MINTSVKDLNSQIAVVKKPEILALKVENVFQAYQEGTQILKDVSFLVNDGELCCILGPSGSGKTTLLKIIAGLILPDAGKVIFRGMDFTKIPANQRNIGLVFQKFALFPYMSAFDNVAFPLRVRKLQNDVIEEKVFKALELVDLSEHANKRPHQLSGGQQQRVALARAIVFEPTLLLMDEPLASLDRRLRQALQIELRNLQQKLGIACVYVTHDQEEAMVLADRIILLRDGHIVADNKPSELYQKPGSVFVADFLGDANILPGVVVDVKNDNNIIEVLNYHFTIPASKEIKMPGQQVWVVVRPELIDCSSIDEGIKCTLIQCVFLTGHWRLLLKDVQNGQMLIADYTGKNPPASLGEDIFINWLPSNVHILKKN
jgi:ABC-type Fe3+/spermidine/putrescine transport system ATPase subunit